jgi:hypothetical protein
VRGVVGPERVAAILVVLLLAIAVPVTVGFSTRRGGGPPPTAAPPTTASSVAPSVAPSTSPSLFPSPTSTPTASVLSPAEAQLIRNLIGLNTTIFEDGAAIQEEIDLPGGARSQELYELLRQPLQHATTASQMRRPSTIGDLSTFLTEAYAEIKRNAEIGRTAASTNLQVQLESANRTVQAIEALRPLHLELQAALSPGPSPS